MVIRELTCPFSHGSLADWLAGYQDIASLNVGVRMHDTLLVASVVVRFNSSSIT